MQRQVEPEEEEEQEEEEEEPVQTKLVEGARLQRQAEPEEDEEEPIQAKMVEGTHLQRQVEPEEEEEEPVQTKLVEGARLQRQAEPEKDEEEPIQAKLVEGGRLQRETEPEDEDVEEPIQAKQSSGRMPQADPGLEARIHSLRGDGQPLPRSVRDFFEPRFRYDFSQVRIHTSSRAAETARMVKARAFTLGRDIVFGTAQSAPGTSTGKRLLAHELVHVVQQGETQSANKGRPSLQRREETAVKARRAQAGFCAAQIENVRLTPMSEPEVVSGWSGDDLWVKVRPKFKMKCEADVDAAPGCKFALGNFQICRPYDVKRAVWRSRTKGDEFEYDWHERLRKQQPSLDTIAAGDWMRTPKRITGGGHVAVDFRDNPGDNLTKEKPGGSDRFLSGAAWQAFFLTTFSVQLHDNSIRHLKSFYWEAKYCEEFDEKRTSVRKHTFFDYHLNPDIPGESALGLVGTRARPTCNDIVRSTKPEEKHWPGKSDYVCRPHPGGATAQ